MKKEDLKEMASRCRLIARKADKFTRIRLLELASKYEHSLNADHRRQKRKASMTAEPNGNKD